VTDVLRGVRVVELSTVITAPLTGLMLADLGADVLKVEPPQGDPFRSFRGGHYSPNFVAYNRGKRSMKLDLRTAAGRSILLELLAAADVLLENYRPGIMERLGLAQDVLTAANPRLIHCSITGFGESGPYSARPAYDNVAVALSGVLSLQLDPEHPQSSGPTIADNATGMYAAYGILGALYERERSGRGRRIDVNML
jgi:crotonobetainyl-CoA:carnitine CoA-transferase CaiB-like acyl-CoA transferase